MTGEPAVTPGLTLDMRGLKCPLPVLRSRKAFRTLQPGAIVAIETTDPLAGIDIPHMCHEDGHELLSSERTEAGHRFVVRWG